MKTFKRILSSLMVAVMLLTVAPLNGFVGLDINLDWLNFTTKASAATYSGTCGDNVNWNLDTSTGELILSGTGPTYDYDYINFMEEASWSKYREFIKTVVVEEGITAIGKFTFNTLPNFVSIVLPDSLRIIGNAAFNGCEALADITVGTNISEIGNGAFRDTSFYSDSSNWENGALYLDNYLIAVNSGVTGDFVVKENVTLIGRRAFQYCSGIKSVTFPISLLYINQDAFEECTAITVFNYPGTMEQWNLVSVDYGNANYGKGNNIIKKYLIVGTDSGTSQYLSGRYGTNSTWTLYGNGELVINGSGAPYSSSSSGDSWEQHISKIKKVTINDGITGIKTSAFKNCENLVDATIPESVNLIMYSAFENCTSLKSITIPSKVKNIYSKTFYNCTSLENITISGEIEIIEGDAFRNTALPFDGNELYIQGHLVGLKESAQGHYTVREGTIGISGGVFKGMAEMTSITIPESVKYIGNAAFLSCTGLKELTIPEGCTTIYDEAFTNCTGLDFLKLPLSITYIERDDAFTSLDDVKILYPGTESQWKSIYWDYFSYANDYFDCLILECDSERPYYRVSRCGDNAYAKLYTDGELLIYGYGEMRSDIYDQYMYFESFSWTWQYKKSEITSITILEGITYIYPRAFVGCSELTSVILPVSLRTIDTDAFVNEKIETVYFAGTSEQWNAIGYNAWGNSNPEVTFGAVHEHYYSAEITKNPTCTSTGTVLYSCLCGQSYSEVLPMTGHTLEIYHLAPTCVKMGYEYDKCTVCGGEFNRRNYENTVDHIWENEYLPPTCSQEGYHCLRCSVCSAQKDVTGMSKLQHATLEWVVLNEPACEESGIKIQRCTACLTEVDRAEISASGHEAGDWETISEATCTEKGIIVQKCVNCETELDRSEIPAPGHKAGEWTVETGATCDQAGLKVRTCNICKEVVESEKIPSVEHVLGNWEVDSEPSCLHVGFEVRKCTLCLKSIKSRIIPKTSHTYGEWMVITEPTSTQEGEKAHTCIVCSSVESQAISPTGFEPVNGLQIDFANNIIYGLDAACTSLDGYSNFLTSSYSWSYTTTNERLGTGSKAVLTGESTYTEYTIVIFGDVNGDGWYDGTDSIIVSCLANGMLSKDDVSPAFYEAADCNHDGVIDSFDVALLEQAGLLLSDVDQSKSAEELATDEAYIEYLDLIDQTPDVEAEDEPEAGDVIPEQNEAGADIFDLIIDFIKSIFDMLINIISK